MSIEAGLSADNDANYVYERIAVAEHIPPTECDIVMEGGVTSGVVYPRFVTGLARRFTLRSIGGTSVGAVAAAAAAAAQYRRNAGGGSGGFDQLEKLPQALAETVADGRSRLFSLFQPCADLKPHFAVIEEALNRHSMVTRIGALAGGLLQQFQVGALIAAAVLVAWRWTAQTLPQGVLAWLGFAVSLLLASLLGAGLQFALTAWRGLRRNRCGICSGMSGEDSELPALTVWLHGLVQQMAGLPGAKPLTFGMLRQSSPSIELAFITTGISELSSHRLPHASADLLFRASELRQLFPAAVVKCMVEASLLRRTPRRETLALLHAADPHFDTAQRDLYFLPDADDLPVLVGARLSLSFPILLQAVPLYRLRFTEGDGVVRGAPGVKPVWLSDGGLTSNFPIHFFDELLPQRPTFGVSLQSTLAEKAPDSERVILPENNNQGWTPPYVDIQGRDGLPSPLTFIGALLVTMRTWRHEALKRTPGYRDRVVVIRHTAAEGGLNLNMPPSAIASMSGSGALAAEKVIKRFLDTEGVENGWLNHRQVRMRCAAAVLQPKLEQLAKAWSKGDYAYAAQWQDAELQKTIAYRLTHHQQKFGALWWQGLSTAATQRPHADLTRRSPKPQPTLDVAPRQT